jgi:hypothetical protein
VSRAIEQIIADERENARMLKRMGNEQQATYLLNLFDEIAGSLEDYVTWLSEEKSMLKSGLSARTLRRRFRELFDCGLARYNMKHEREYRSIAIPSRPEVEQAKREAWAA